MTDIDQAMGWRDGLVVERRSVLKVLGGTLLASAVPLSRAAAAEGELVVQNWGGAAEKAVLHYFGASRNAIRWLRIPRWAVPAGRARDG